MSQGLTLAAMIKNERTRNAMTQEELATAVGVKVITISFWETGRAVPKAANIKRLSKALKVPVKQLTTFLSD